MRFDKVIGIAALLSVVCSLAPAQSSQPEKQSPKHCVVQTEAVRQGESTPIPSPAARPQCFGTFQEALLFATNGSVKVAPDFLPQELTSEVLGKSAVQPLATFVIGIEYEHADFGGSSILYQNSVSCVGFQHSVSFVGEAWNDRISSARAFSNCNHAVHFEHANFVGASVDCFSACSYIGDAMNDRTSSIRWFQ
jgi:hypothetical protein